jgi:hypothetical protein
MSDPHYLIGELSYTSPLTAEQKQQCLTDIEQTPARLRAALRGLSGQEPDTPYRDGGWTRRQVAHHVADKSHELLLKKNIDVRCICGSALLTDHYGSPASIKHPEWR